MELAQSNDVSAEFLTHREDVAAAGGADEMLRWLERNPGTAVSKAVKGVGEPEAVELEPFPTDRQPPEGEGMLGSVARNIAEVPKQIAGGVDDAVRHATTFLNPLTDWLNENVADLRYDPVGKPKTTTGSITRSLSEFLTGFVPALKGLRAVGATGKVAAPLTAAAISDFAVRDPHEARLSNLWNQLGLPRMVLTDYLAADASDSALEGRFKSAIESAGLGLAGEGVFLAARAVKAARRVRTLDANETEFLKGKYGELDDKALASAIGDPSKPMIETVVKQPPAAGGKIAKAEGAAAGTQPDDLLARGLIDAGESQVYVNFARINGPDEVKSLVGTMADRFKGSIDDATRGEISHAETTKMADELGMSVTDLLSRRKGQVFNAEEAVAARKLLTASGEKLLDAAKKAASPNAGPLDQFAFRRMMAVHAAIQAEVVGARTETARALSSWRIPTGGGVENARAIEQVMAAMGGPEASIEMAKRLAILAETGASAATINRIAQAGWGARSFDAIRELWVNGLLSSPATHVVNSTSNLLVAIQQIYERGAAAQIGALRGSEGVAMTESLAMAHGLVASTKDAFRMAWQALRTGETGAALNKVDLPIAKAISADALQISSETGMGRMVDLLGQAVRMPGRFLGAEDEFFKTIGYRMELHAQAARNVAQSGLKGKEATTMYRDIIANPPENIRIAAADAALYNTFTNQPGAIGQTFLNLREKVPAVAFVLPFIRTPVNIARYSFERTPLAPLVGQWRADIAAGGARADLAMARMATGTGIMLMALDWADSGLISGQGPGPTSDKGEREAMTRQGWQPYSVNIGGRWYSYNRTDPLGVTLGFAADIAQMIRKGEISNDDVDELGEVLGMATATIGQVAVNKTYLRGMSELTQVFSDGRRYGTQYVENLISSFVPGTALMGSVARAGDPTAREVNSIADAVYSRIHGLRATLPPKRNLWGEEIKTESGLGKTYDFLSPSASRKIDATPVDTELMRLAQAQQDGWESSAPTRIGKKTHFDGVAVNFKEWPDVYDEYVKLAGNGLVHPAWRMGAKDYLNAVISGKHPMSTVYQLGSDERKLAFISKTVGDYRELAQKEIMADPRFEDFNRTVQQLKLDKLQRRLPQTVK